MLTDTSVGDCGINRVVSLVDNAHLFALFCAVRALSMCSRVVAPSGLMLRWFVFLLAVSE
jgi:hypothetical protein